MIIENNNNNRHLKTRVCINCSTTITDADKIATTVKDTNTIEKPLSSGFESDESDESDLIGVKTKDDAIISKDSSQTSIETREYSNNTHLNNEKTVKENEATAGHHPSEDGKPLKSL